MTKRVERLIVIRELMAKAPLFIALSQLHKDLDMAFNIMRKINHFLEALRPWRPGMAENGPSGAIHTGLNFENFLLNGLDIGHHIHHTDKAGNGKDGNHHIKDEKYNYQYCM